jgi:hypothetical protein
MLPDLPRVNLEDGRLMVYELGEVANGRYARSSSNSPHVYMIVDRNRGLTQAAM